MRNLNRRDAAPAALRNGGTAKHRRYLRLGPETLIVQSTIQVTLIGLSLGQRSEIGGCGIRCEEKNREVRECSYLAAAFSIDEFRIHAN